MKVGDYVRTKYGISQYKYYKVIGSDDILGIPVKDGSRGIFANKEDIIKSSPNIIDLLEVGDYVNGHRVNYINKDREHFNISFGNEDFDLTSKFNSDIYWLSKEDIKSIVTKEQFESMEYRIGA